MDIIIQTYMCIHNYTKRYSVTQTHGHTDKKLDKHTEDSHTQTHLPWAIHCTDRLYATCVDYSKSTINDIYTEVISFFLCRDRHIPKPVRGKCVQFSADLWFVCLYFVFHRQLLNKAGKSRRALCVCICIYILLAWRITQSQDYVSFMSVCSKKIHGFQ